MVFRGLSVGVIIRLTNQNVRYILTFTLVIAASKSDEKWESYPKKKQKIAILTGKNFFFLTSGTQISILWPFLLLNHLL